MRLQARPSGLPVASSDSRQATRAVDHTRPVPFHLYVRTLPLATDCTRRPSGPQFMVGGARCLSKELSGAGSGRVSDFAVVGVALGVEADVADRRPVSDLARPPRGVGGAGFGIESGTPTEEFAVPSGVPGVGCDEPDRAVAVLVVVPGHETGDPALRVLLAGETRCRPVRPVLAGPEQGFRERVDAPVSVKRLSRPPGWACGEGRRSLVRHSA